MMPIMDACPSCGTPGSQVRDSRPMPGYPTWRRRRRFCAAPACGARWWTVEMPEEVLIDGRATVPQVVNAVETALRELTRLKEKLAFELPPVEADKWELHRVKAAIHDG